jgi:sugar phosphate isomerase/epimerase
MELGIFAKTFTGVDPLAVLGAAKVAGYTTVQYNMACSGLSSMPDQIDGAVEQSVAMAANQTGVSIAAISGTYNMIHPDLAVRKQGYSRLNVLAASCKILGTNLITLCTGTRDANDQWHNHPDNQSPEAWRDLLTSFEAAIAIADKHDVFLGIEPELANVVNSAIRAKQLIEEVQSPRLKIIFDAANLFEVASPAEQRLIISHGLEMLGDYIAMAHAKDRNSDGSFATAGQGVIDFEHYFVGLRLVNFSGPIITHGLHENEAKPVNEFLKSVLKKVEN